jgi:hypothetical protein
METVIFEDDYLPVGHHAMLEAYRAQAYGTGWRLCNETLPGLFVGPIESRRDVSLLKIDTVISILQSHERDEPRYPPLPEGITEHKYELDDSLYGVISFEFLWDIIMKIYDALTRLKHRVLVHCAAGRSRSASIMIAYFLATGIDSTAADALKRLRVSRPCVHPNDAFMTQLTDMESRLHGLVVGL